MAYLTVEDFAQGIDLRKSLVTAKPGSLRVLKNGFVNAGGEIEKRRKFASMGTAPNSFGIGALDGVPQVFRLNTSPAGTVPALVAQHTLTPNPALATGVQIARVLDSETFGSKLFTIARLTDGSIRHFHDGAEVAHTVKGKVARTHRTKLYTVDGNLAEFSAVGNPADWTGTGSGSIDVTTQDAGGPDLVGVEPYYNQLALLGRKSIQLWSMDPDPAKNQIVQTLGNIGLVGPNAAARYGTGDVLFLSNTGIRSLRAQNNGSNAATVNDVGSPIDDLIQEARRALSSTDAERIFALVDPLTGHFWLCWGTKIYVLAYYPATKVSAWGLFEPGFDIHAAAVCGSRIILRSNDDLYVHGSVPTTSFDFYSAGPIADEYDATVCELETPMLDATTPATKKDWTGIDVAAEGTWDVWLNPAPDNPAAWDHAATVENSTFALARIPYEASSTHIAVKMKSKGTGRHRLGSLVLHYAGDGESS